MSAAPATLAGARIVYVSPTGERERVVDGGMVARLLEIHRESEDLFDPEAIACDVRHVAAILSLLADAAGGENGEDGENACALYLLEGVLKGVARRLDAMRAPATRPDFGTSYRIDAK